MAKFKNTSRSFTKLMNYGEPRTMVVVTFTIPPEFSVTKTKYSQDFDRIKEHLQWQAKSFAYHWRQLMKSKRFRKKLKKLCALENIVHYLWTLELQEKGDIHLHAVLFIHDDPKLIQAFIALLHEHRAKHDGIVKRYHRDKQRDILPLGRCHIMLHPKFEPALRELSYFDTEEKLNKQKQPYEPKRFEHFLSDLAHFHYKYDRSRRGQGTAVEFLDSTKLKQSYEGVVEYITKITEAKYSESTKTKRTKEIVHNTMVEHHTKGYLETDNAKLKLDAMVFAEIGVKTVHYSEALFPTSFYQSIRDRLISFDGRYKSLYHLSLDYCNGIVRIEKDSGYKLVIHNDAGVIASENIM